MIFDEAHQLPDIASQYFGQYSPVDNCSTWQKTSPSPIAPIKRHPAVTKVRRPPCPERAGFRLQLGEPGYRGNLRELLAIRKFSGHFYCSMTPWNFVMTGETVAGAFRLAGCGI